jgi:hypothetical protein
MGCGVRDNVPLKVRSCRPPLASGVRLYNWLRLPLRRKVGVRLAGVEYEEGS